MSLAAEPRAPYLSQQGPWRPRDLSRVLLSSGLGAAGLVVGWYGTAGEVRLRDEVVWLVASTAATAFAGLAMTTWLTSGMRTVRSEHRFLQQRLLAELEADVSEDAQPADATVTADGMRFYHRASCVFVAGKQGRVTNGAGLSACSWCRP